VNVSNDRARVGISACLLGEAVRYDSGHKRDDFLLETLGPLVEWVPVCPEVEAGFGTPRDPMRLERDDGHRVSLVVIRTGEDVTERLQQYVRVRLDQLAGERLSGYVLKSESPSCGMERVKVYGAAGAAALPQRTGRGLFAAGLMAAFPSLPVEEDGRLADQALRENFLARVFAYQHARERDLREYL
jgi:uncharacterized protein YbbK (DUF523 family)